MNLNYHINVSSIEGEDESLRVAVADEDGNIIAVQEFRPLPSEDLTTTNMRAMEWTVMVILTQVIRRQG